MRVFQTVLWMAATLLCMKTQTQLYTGAQGATDTLHRFSPLLQTDLDDDDITDEDDPAHLPSGILQSGSSLSDLFVWEKPNNNKLTGTAAMIIEEISQICPKNEFFYSLNPRHKHAVWKLREFLMEQRTPQEWREAAVYLRDREEINPHVWLRAVVSSIVHRRDIPELGVPPMAEVIPSLFFTTEVLDAVKNSMSSKSNNTGLDCLVLDDESVGKDNGFENLAWYFREDIMVNSHHWYWHLANPMEGGQGPDRGGELFYWLHHDMVARYHSERLSLGLLPMRPFDMEPGSLIPLAYNPHMYDGNSGKNWSARPANQQVSDINWESLSANRTYIVSVRNRSTKLNQVLDGISKGLLINRGGQTIYLNGTAGLNSLGNIVEANERSEDKDENGSRGIHNDGHLIISLVLDPRNEQGTPPGVMGDMATAMRDVMFYQYHVSINNIFKRQKATLQSYQLTQGEWPLLLEGISIRSFTVYSQNSPSNQLHTFWSSAKYDLSRGLDFGRLPEKGPLLVCVKHLDHEDFQYDLTIVRISALKSVSATVRLYMGPRYDPHGRRYSLEEQRHLMFVLDKFRVTLKVGVNNIRRNSTQTPLTISFGQSLGQLENETNNGQFCGCGWPHHLLIPKGNRNGLSFDIFAIITNGEDTEDEPIEDDQKSCRPAHIYCGLIGKKYPDARPMGYPFDRKLFVSDNDREQISSLDHLVRELPNSAYAHVKVVHFDEFRKKPGTE